LLLAENQNGKAGPARRVTNFVLNAEGEFNRLDARKNVSASEAKGRFGDLLRRVGKGETISTCSEAFVLPTWRRQILARSGPSRRSWRNSPASTRGIRLRNITVR